MEGDATGRQPTKYICLSLLSLVRQISCAASVNAAVFWGKKPGYVWSGSRFAACCTRNRMVYFGVDCCCTLPGCVMLWTWCVMGASTAVFVQQNASCAWQNIFLSLLFLFRSVYLLGFRRAHLPYVTMSVLCFLMHAICTPFFCRVKIGHICMCFSCAFCIKPDF